MPRPTPVCTSHVLSQLGRMQYGGGPTETATLSEKFCQNRLGPGALK